MDRVNEGFEHIASLLLEVQRRMQHLVAENTQLQEELAALRRGAGVMVVIEGRAYPLIALPTPVEPLESPFS